MSQAYAKITPPICMTCNGRGIMSYFCNSAGAPGWDDSPCPDCIMYLVNAINRDGEASRFLFSKWEYAESKRNELLESLDDVFLLVEIETFQLNEITE